MQDAGLAVQMRVHLWEDPEGGVPRHALGAWSGVKEPSAAQPPHDGGWVVGTLCVLGGWWSAARRGARARGGCTAHRPSNFTLKRLKRCRSSRLIKGRRLTSGARGEPVYKRGF